MNKTNLGNIRRAMRGLLLILAAVLVISVILPMDAQAQFFGGLAGYHGRYIVRHMEFELAHSVMTDRVVFDDQGYIDLAMTKLHPMAVRDLFPYPWLFRDDQLREMNYNPIIFWSIPYYLPSYDDMFRIYTIGGGYFFGHWGRAPWYGYWERAWAGYYGRFPYDAYWGWWQYNFYFVDYPYGGWWLSGHKAMDTLSAQVDSVQVEEKAGWPVGLWVREPLPSALASADLSGMSVMETMALAGKADQFYLPGQKASVVQLKKAQMPRITKAYRDFLPGPGPQREGRSISGDASSGPSSSSGSFGSSGSSGGGSKQKSKTKK